MFQSSFTGIKPLHRNTSYKGGFCQFWYIPVEDVAVFPRVGANQRLVAEPTLLAGKSWFGPIEVPKNQLGFVEDFDRTKAGPYYKTKLASIIIGDSEESRINIRNMTYHRYLVVGKQRAGGAYLLIGTLDSWCTFTPEYKSGNGPGETAATEFSFTTEHISNAYILPSFNSDATAPVNAGEGGGGGSMANQTEIIPFADVAAVNIPWTATRLEKFGSFPLVEVWIEEEGQQPFLNFGANIECDAPPPAMTELNVKLGLGNPSGFIVIK
ncbi:MAG TPA: hypothetical protein VFS36_06395 [Chitinophagaceae bacterium]|nr:hypothetical protein [Chitinophagaceae bacterium]